MVVVVVVVVVVALAVVVVVVVVGLKHSVPRVNPTRVIIRG